MAWRVVWTDPAWLNLEAAADYIAQDSPRYAAGLVREARDAARSLSHLANRGRIVPEVNDVRVRELFVWRYRLIYRVTDRTVEVPSALARIYRGLLAKNDRARRRRCAEFGARQDFARPAARLRRG